MKKIISLILIVLLVAGVYWFFTNQKPETITTNINNQNELQADMVNEIDPEKVIQDADNLDQDEEELDALINDLENMKF